MRRLIIWNMVTLDGFFEGLKTWEIDWHELVWGEELEQLSIDQLKSADMLLFGRVQGRDAVMILGSPRLDRNPTR